MPADAQAVILIQIQRNRMAIGGRLYAHTKTPSNLTHVDAAKLVSQLISNFCSNTLLGGTQQQIIYIDRHEDDVGTTKKMHNKTSVTRTSHKTDRNQIRNHKLIKQPTSLLQTIDRLVKAADIFPSKALCQVVASYNKLCRGLPA